MKAELYEPTANEPKMRPAIRDSFLFVPTVGMRSPETLMLELFREIFFETHYGNSGAARALNPDDTDSGQPDGFLYTEKERVALNAFRGRRKETKMSRVNSYYVPAYPQLAEWAWLRKRSDRVIKSLLFEGAFVQHLWRRGEDAEASGEKQKEIAQKTVDALIGANGYSDSPSGKRDIMAVTLGRDSFLNIDREESINRLCSKLGHKFVMRVEADELSGRITDDFLAICDLEPSLSRLIWVQVLMTFLRFALPMWLLAQMQMTKSLHRWLMEAVNNNNIVPEREIVTELTSRNRGLLHPTLTATREVFSHIEQYMKCRVEINILFYWLERLEPSFENIESIGLKNGEKRFINIEQLLLLARNNAVKIRGNERFAVISEGLDIQTFLTREGERFAAWRNPLLYGQGKNINEFFRVLYRAESGDESGGHLLVPENRGASRGFRVFPGQLLLKIIIYAAAMSKRSGKRGKLILSDVEEHFAQYGIDFSVAADARSLLMQELQSMGLLTGSPDAGSSVTVDCPY